MLSAQAGSKPLATSDSSRPTHHHTPANLWKLWVQDIVLGSLSIVEMYMETQLASEKHDRGNANSKTKQESETGIGSALSVVGASRNPS